MEHLLLTAGVAEGCVPAIRTLADADWRDSYKAHFRAWSFGRLHWVPVWERENFTLPDLPSYTRRGLIDTRRESARAWEGCQALHVKAESAEFICEKLSGGNQQKVVLGKWLAMRPRVLIFDEPTRGIDVNARSEFYGIMRRLADAGTLVLMISSDMEEILGVSDRIIVMHEGRITATLERGAFDEETIMRHATGIDMQQTTTAA